MAKKNQRPPDIHAMLIERLQNKGVEFWFSTEGLAAIEKVVARHKAIDGILITLLESCGRGKEWAEKKQAEEFLKINSAYPICTHYDYSALIALGAVIADLTNVQLQRFAGWAAQHDSGTAARKKSEDAELERVYLEYMKGYPRATIKAFLKYYENTDKPQTNNLEKRLKAIRKKNGMAKKSPSKTN